MRRRYRRRSTTSWIIWGLAFFGGIAAMSWQFGWLPDEADLMEYLSTTRKSNEVELQDKDEFLSSGETGSPSLTRTPPSPLNEADVYAKLAEQVEKRKQTAATGNTVSLPPANHPLRQPGSPAGQPIPSEDPNRTRAVANAPVRNSLYLRPQNSPSQITGAGSQVVPAANEVIQYPAANNSGNIVQVSAVPQALQQQLLQIDQLVKDGKALSAHRELSTLYWSHPERRSAFQDRLDKTAESIYFSSQPHYMQPYQIQYGDQLQKIAAQYNTPWQYLAKLNRIDPRKIRPGQELKVIKGPFSAIVELSRFELTIHAHGYFVKKYLVGIGRDGASPVGKLSVLNKVSNPQYTGPDNRVVAADDPANPLGEHWLDLGNGYGIHGTIDPQSIGKSESRGCIRMLNSDVAEVYDLLGNSSVVEIRR